MIKSVCVAHFIKINLTELSIIVVFYTDMENEQNFTKIWLNKTTMKMLGLKLNDCVALFKFNKTRCCWKPCGGHRVWPGSEKQPLGL